MKHKKRPVFVKLLVALGIIGVIVSWIVFEALDIEKTTMFLLTPTAPTGIRKPDKDEIPVYDANDLTRIGHYPAYPLDGSYIQMCNIDLSSYDNWEPIGNFAQDQKMFTGVFDGNGFVIRNLSIANKSNDYQGLFGYLGNLAKVINIKVENANVTGNKCVGVLAGYNEGYVDHCAVTGYVSGVKHVGVLVGANGGTINKSVAHGMAECKNTEGANIGGLVGSNGLNNSKLCKVAYCYSTADVISQGKYTGGLIGSNLNGAEIINCYALGSVSNTNSGTGGLLGINVNSIVANCYSVGSVIGNGEAEGGLVGFNNGNVLDSYWNLETSEKIISAGGTGKNMAEMKQQKTFVNWNFIKFWEIEDGISYPYLKLNEQIPHPR